MIEIPLPFHYLSYRIKIVDIHSKFCFFILVTACRIIAEPWWAEKLVSGDAVGT